MNFFNADAFRNASQQIKRSPAGFRFAYLSRVFTDEAYKKLLAAYPSFSHFRYFEDDCKKVYEGPYYDSRENKGCLDHLAVVPSIWREVIKEANSPEFTSLFSSSTGIAFNAIRNFSFKCGKQGCEIKPHLDGAAKSKKAGRSQVVSLFYFGERPGAGPGGTCIYDTDRETILAEAQDLYNSMLFFEQHPDAWHGYRPLAGSAERKAVAITFAHEAKQIPLKTGLSHKLFCPHWLLSRFSRAG